MVQVLPNWQIDLRTYNGLTSETIPILYGVPQGSVLGPVIFILYVAGVISIARAHGFKAHSYADDLQI